MKSTDIETGDPGTTKGIRMTKQTRDLRGRWTASTTNVPEASKGRFATRTEIDVSNTSADDTVPGMERPRYAPAGDDLAQGGQHWPAMYRIPVLVAEEDDAFTTYGNRQGSTLRAAARRQGGGDMNPVATLTGADIGLNRGTRARIRPDVPGHARLQPPEGQEGTDDGLRA